MQFTFSKELHYLLHRADGEQVAHCLDMDLVGSGSTEDEAIDELNNAVRALVFFAVQTKTFDIGSLCKRAPREYWTMFEDAKEASGTETRTLEVSPEIAPVTVEQCNFTYCLAVAAA
jgi:hypothetical protein